MKQKRNTTLYLRRLLITMKITVAIILAFAALCVGKKSYDGYSGFRITPKTIRGRDAINELKNDSSLGVQLDFWRMSHTLDDPTDVMVPPKYVGHVEEFLKRREVDFSVLFNNVEDLIQARAVCSSDITQEEFYKCYHTIEEIDSWMDSFAALYPERVSIVKVSETYEGRDVNAIKISGRDSNRPAAVFQGGIHGREWISPATLINIANRIVVNYGVNGEITGLVDFYDIYIIPVLNKDGYAYTWTDERFWAKNRHPVGDTCVGVNLNRNWNVGFGQDGTHSSPCSEIYLGPGPLSEAETSGMDAWARALQASTGIHVFVDFHSYGQYWMWPWGYRYGLPHTPDHLTQLRCATGTTMVLEDVYGTTYKVGQSSENFPAAGNTEDWAYHTLGVKYSYVVGLRPAADSTVGFLLPDSKIEPSAIETLEAVKILLLYAARDPNPNATRVDVLP